MKHATELVWDCDGCATVTSGAFVLPAGLSTARDAVPLLVTAASASLLNTFMELTRAADVSILGYVAQQRAALDALGNVNELSIMASISVPSYDAALKAQTLWARAVRDAPVLRTLACPVSCEPCIVVLSEGDAAEERRA